MARTPGRVLRIAKTRSTAQRARLNKSLAIKIPTTMGPWSPASDAAFQIKVDPRRPQPQRSLPLARKMRQTGLGPGPTSASTLRREIVSDLFREHQKTNKRRLSTGLRPPTFTKTHGIPVSSVSPASDNSPRKLTGRDLFFMGLLGAIFFL